MGDDLLIRLFQRHFNDPVMALRRLELHLTRVDFPFDLALQLRELEFPLQPKQKPPASFVYYFVPNTGRGSDQQTPSDPLHPSFVRTADGIAINLGCPVRLLRALDALSQLSDEDQEGPKAELRRAGGHLAAIEELLWLSGWKSQTQLRRGGQIGGMRGDVDWAFQSTIYQIILEAKFRASDWPRLTDGDSFSKMEGGFLSNALHKFPHPPPSPALHIVGITLFDNITEDIVYRVAEELRAAPQIHAVVFRSLISMTHVVSLKHRTCKLVRELLAVPSIRDLPDNYIVIFHRAEREKRVTLRPTASVSANRAAVYCLGLPPSGDFPPVPEVGLYRITIPSHSPDGEPKFTVVPKWLVEPATPSSPRNQSPL